MILQIMNKAAFIEITVLIVAIVGIVMILKDNNLLVLAKVVWLIFLLTFNFVALGCFLFWRYYERKKLIPDNE